MADKGRLITLVEYIPAMIILGIIRMMPYHVSLAIARLLGRLVYYLVGSARHAAVDGLKHSFPSWPRDRILRTAKKSMEHMMMGFFELPQIPAMSNERISKLVRFHGWHHLTAALSQKQGAIVLSGHLGGWEYILAASGVRGVNTCVLVRPLDNRMLDRHVERYREAKGATTIPRNSYAMRRMYKALKNNRPVAFMIDQNWAVDGVFVPFFGRLASTAKGPMQLALKTGTPVICAYDIRRFDGTHDVTIQPFSVEHKDSWEESVRYNTAKYTRFFEDIIRAHPSQWLWAHTRWRTRP